MIEIYNCLIGSILTKTATEVAHFCKWAMNVAKYIKNAKIIIAKTKLISHVDGICGDGTAL